MDILAPDAVETTPMLLLKTLPDLSVTSRVTGGFLHGSPVH